MKRSKKQVVLINWDFDFKGTYDAGFYDSFAKFVSKGKRNWKIPSEYAVCMIGNVCSKDGVTDERQINTAPVVSIKRLNGQRFVQKMGTFCWKNGKVRRVYCVRTRDGGRYYFRMRNASVKMTNCLEYISLSR